MGVLIVDDNGASAFVDDNGGSAFVDDVGNFTLFASFFLPLILRLRLRR